MVHARYRLFVSDYITLCSFLQISQKANDGNTV
jgi:hypothetical protein